VSDEAKDLVTRMLEKDPTKRISAEEALAHRWFTI
jgi:serine/threonine protein kinase